MRVFELEFRNNYCRIDYQSRCFVNALYWDFFIINVECTALTSWSRFREVIRVSCGCSFIISFGLGARGCTERHTWLRMHPSNGVHDPWLGLVTLIASAVDDPALSPPLPEAYPRLIFNSTSPLIHPSGAYSIISGYVERNVFIVGIFRFITKLKLKRQKFICHNAKTLTSW